MSKHGITREQIEKLINDNSGLLRLEPAWVARNFLPPGRRFGLPDDQYELGDRGGICERWLASTTPADNAVKVDNEGLSFIKTDGEQITLKAAVKVAGDLVMGSQYHQEHAGLGKLAKIFDYAERLPYHLHQMKEHARLVGCNSKEEAYYFPEGVDMGPSPETYFGVHPYIARDSMQEVLLKYLKEWKDDTILQHSRAYKQIPGDGWHVPAGTLHAPGSALTIELQEDSDVFAMLQAKVGDTTIDKSLLFKDVTQADRERQGEASVLEMVNWEVNGDPYFYENRHTPQVPIENGGNGSGDEYWIFYNTDRFSGKKLVVKPGGTYRSIDKGAYNLLVWHGRGTFGGLAIEGQNPDLDEIMVCHARAVKTIEVNNSSDVDLVIFKFFSPEINPDVPMLTHYPA